MSPDARANATTTTTRTRLDARRCRLKRFFDLKMEISAPALVWTEGRRRVDASGVGELER